MNRRGLILGAGAAAIAGGAFATAKVFAGDVNAFSPAKLKLRQKEAIRIQVWTDSTGNGRSAPREWPYLFADWLGQEYQGRRVQVLPWDAVERDYGKPEIVSVGGGAPVTITNFAVPGATMQYGMGSLWQKAIGVERPDVVILSMGLNIALGRNDLSVIRGEFLSALLQLRETHPDVPVILVKQNPFTDVAAMHSVYRVIDELALQGGYSVVDVASKFRPDLYLPDDNTHPNQRGQEVYASAIRSMWAEAAASNVRQPSPVAFRSNLLTDNWVAGGAGVLSWDGRAMSATDGYAYISQSFSAPDLALIKGKKITFAVQVGTDDDANDGQGVIFVGWDGAEPAVINTYAKNPVGGGLIWRSIAGLRVPEDATRVVVGIYHDMAPESSQTSVVVERTVLSVDEASHS